MGVTLGSLYVEVNTKLDCVNLGNLLFEASDKLEDIQTALRRDLGLEFEKD